MDFNLQNDILIIGIIFHRYFQTTSTPIAKTMKYLHVLQTNSPALSTISLSDVTTDTVRETYL